jgi:DNA repair exonuclease SbcCD ATPase subunit
VKRSGFSNLVVKNFQSILDADVPLGPLTVIVGDNAAGKSALLRAIRYACFNQTGTDYITHGKDKTTVDLTLFDGDANTHLLRWRKKREGGATYDLYELDTNGELHPGEQQHFSKLGAAVPPEVSGVLGIAQIEVDKTLTITPQIHTQGEYAFLIDRPDGQAARALAKMTKLDVVVEAQGLIRGDLRKAKQGLSAEGALIESLDLQMKEFDGLDAEVELLENVAIGIDLIEMEQRRIIIVRQQVGLYDEARRTVEGIGDLPADDTMDGLKSAFNWLLDARRTRREYEAAEAEMLIGTLPEVMPLLAKYGRLEAQYTAHLDLTHADSVLTEVLEEQAEVEKVYGYLVDEWNQQDLCPECGQPMPKIGALPEDD